MDSGLKKLLTLITNEPHKTLFVDRYLVLAADLPETEREVVTLDLARTLIAEVPRRALAIAHMVFKFSPDSQEAVNVMASALEELGRGGKAQELRDEFRKMLQGHGASSKRIQTVDDILAAEVKVPKPLFSQPRVHLPLEIPPEVLLEGSKKTDILPPVERKRPPEPKILLKNTPVDLQVVEQYLNQGSLFLAAHLFAKFHKSWERDQVKAMWEKLCLRFGVVAELPPDYGMVAKIKHMVQMPPLVRIVI